MCSRIMSGLMIVLLALLTVSTRREEFPQVADYAGYDFSSHGEFNERGRSSRRHA